MNWPWSSRPVENANHAAPLLTEIDAAHAESLAVLDRLAQEEGSRAIFSALRRYAETWEMRLLAARVGAELSNQTLAEINGVFATLADFKSLMDVLLKPIPNKEGKDINDLGRFAETLLKQNSTPVG